MLQISPPKRGYSIHITLLKQVEEIPVSTKNMFMMRNEKNSLLKYFSTSQYLIDLDQMGYQVKIFSPQKDMVRSISMSAQHVFVEK